jgi:phospholipid/cholesterol/gamma-HCH transport system permease protein
MRNAGSGVGVVSVTVGVDRDGDRGRLVPTGPFDLAHAAAVAQAVEHSPPELEGCRSIDVDLGQLDRIDGAGAVLLAGFLDRLDAGGKRTQVLDDGNAEAARLVALYRARREERQAPAAPRRNALTRIGVAGSALPVAITGALDFAGRCAAAIPKAVAVPRSVNWGSLPRLLQEIGADGLVVTGAANFLVGLIIGLLGISQLARFGAVAYVPELVVVAQFRELGPLVTAIVVAGRSGAGLASELATMKVSEEIDALRSMGFDPVRWLVVPRCVALVIVLPLLTWIGNGLALLGGFLATAATTDMPVRAYLFATTDAITIGNLAAGLVKAPFLALAIGLISCRQGLAAQGGAAAVGAKTTSAVVMAILGVIVTNALFTFFYTLLGI